jgi:hypothetical protein
MEVTFRTVASEGSGWVDQLSEEFFVQVDRSPSAGEPVEVLVRSEDGISQIKILGIVTQRDSNGFRVCEEIDIAARRELRKHLGG